MKKIFKTVFGIGLLVSPVSAELTEYRLGHFLESVFDVFGFNFLEITTLIPTLFILGFALGCFIIFKMIWNRIK